jgi:hypothetical protein
LASSDINWFITGDFNEVGSLVVRRRVMRNNKMEEMLAFNSFIVGADLEDLPLVGRKYMWYRGHGITMSRLYHYIVSLG